MNYASIINSPATIAAIAEAVGYGEINSGNAIMYKANTNEWALVEGGKVAARTAQGWVEAVSAATIDSLGLIGETSDEGTEEAGKIVEWMKSQA
jgi:hypothetical protein